MAISVAAHNCDGGSALHCISSVMLQISPNSSPLGPKIRFSWIYNWFVATVWNAKTFFKKKKRKKKKDNKKTIDSVELVAEASLAFWTYCYYFYSDCLFLLTGNLGKVGELQSVKWLDGRGMQWHPAPAVLSTWQSEISPFHLFSAFPIHLHAIGNSVISLILCESMWIFFIPPFLIFSDQYSWTWDSSNLQFLNWIGPENWVV